MSLGFAGFHISSGENHSPTPASGHINSHIAGPEISLFGQGYGGVSVLPAIAPSICAATARAVSRDSSGVRIVENSAPTNAIRILPAQAPALMLGAPPSPHTFTRVAGVTRLSDGTIVVADDLPVEIRAFDSTGVFLRRIGRQGQGPGEYERVSSLVRLARDTLLVSDNRERRFNYFSRDGRVIRTESREFVPNMATRSTSTRPLPANIDVLAKSSDGTYVATLFTYVRTFGEVRGRGPLVGRDSIGLFTLDPAGQIVRRLGTVSLLPTFSRPEPGDNSGLRIGVTLPFGSEGAFAVGDGAVFQTLGAEYEILERDLRGSITRIIRRCAAPPAVTRADIARWRSAYVATALPQYRSRFEETAGMIPYPASAPAYGQLVVDGMGRLWAREFTMSDDAQKWNVFNAMGEYVTDVSLPAGLRVVEIGRDYLLGISVDADMTQSVRLYRLRS